MECFHEKLSDSNSNKITDEFRGIMLQYQRYGRAFDICKRIDRSIIQNAFSSYTTIPDALTDFILPANSEVDSGQRISVLAAAAPNNYDFDPDTSTYD